MTKKHIAIWLHGGVGTGHFAQGYPMLEKILDGLSETFIITVYSQAAPHPTYRPLNFSVRSAGPEWRNGTLRWLALVGLFSKDHFRRRYALVFSFWGYPAGIFSVVLGGLLNIPRGICVLGGDAAGIPSIGYGILHKPFAGRLARWIYNRASVLMAISGYQRDHLVRHGVTKKITVIPWGVDPAMYTFSRRTRRDVLKVIHVGHHTPVKDQFTLLDTFARIRWATPALLHIFGQDNMNGALLARCRELGIDKDVTFFDVVPYNDMPAHYEWADMMIHTSLSEGQCMAITEAAASGIFIAGTSVGLLYDLGESCGILVDPGEGEALAKKILHALPDEDRWNTRVTNAHNWSEAHLLSWTVAEMTRAMLAVMQ